MTDTLIWAIAIVVFLPVAWVVFLIGLIALLSCGAAILALVDKVWKAIR